MDEEIFKLRSGLEIRPESAHPGAPVIVKDPITRRFYRFTAMQAAVLGLLDGTRSAESIASTVAQGFNADVTPAQIREFTRKLRALLLLDHPFCWAKLEAANPRRHRLLSSLLSIKLHAFNPDRLLSWLAMRLSFCFSRSFALIVWLSAGVAAVISISNWKALSLSLPGLISLYSLPLIIITAFAVMTLHEFGHGLALKRYGGKVEEMGFLILYFIPAFYCNLDDAWMLPKRQRILVTLAGGYVQLFIWACATIAWRVLATETVLSRICLIAIVFCSVQALFNFNPLIKLDGYYLLSDYLEMPNLRPRSWNYLKQSFRLLLLGSKESGAPPPDRRTVRIYFIYGSTSFLFSACLFGFMFERVGAWLVGEFQTWGALLSCILLLAAVPTGKGDHDPPPPRGSGIRVRIKRVPGWFILLVALAIVGFFPWELKIAGDFTILPNKKVSVSPQVEGILQTILVDQGDHVKKGSVLAEMENLELSSEYEDTKGELATREAMLRLLKAGTRPEEIDRARKQMDTKRAELAATGQIGQELKMLSETVAKKEVEVRNAEANYQRTQQLFKDGLISKNDAERDQTTYAISQKELLEAKAQLKVLEERTERTRQVRAKELEQAKSELKILLAGTRMETIQATEAEVNKLFEKKGNLEQQLECLKIRSPIDGVIATPYLKNRVGQYLKKGDTLCDIVSQGTVLIDMPVPEKEIGDVRPGFPITLKLRGYPNLSFEAKVKAMAPVAMERGGERMVVVEGELDNLDGILKPEMTGVGKIRCGKRLILNLATRRAIRWLRTEFWEYLP